MRSRATTPLKKPKIRQSWSKYNLYNLSRAVNPPTNTRTFFQQKWKAKSVARTYHGEMVTEGHWERVFSRRLRGVVPMDASYLASNDGSNESAGRGAGLDIPGARRPPPNTPYMQMTFAPLERRLDVAMFRAMFASSARQARQFVVHGHVTVNGKKMRYPGYLLNPGDMFQVDPERVMFATGAPKDSKERRAGRVRRRMGTAPAQASEQAKTEAASTEEDTEGSEKKETTGKEENDKEAEDPRLTLKSLMAQAQSLLSSGRDSLPGKRKQDLRAFRAAVRRVMSRSGSSTALTENLETQFERLKSTLTASLQEKAKAEEQSQQEQQQQELQQESQQPQQPQQESHHQQPQQPPQPPPSEPAKAQQSEAQSNPSEQLTEAFGKASLDPNAPPPDNLSASDLSVLQQALFQLHHNPIDSTKPYATPWRPRDYMSAFAFIPRYLEVNPNICAAVYLRHPVARPGLAEVPTPFSDQVHGSAFAWYLRRR